MFTKDEVSNILNIQSLGNIEEHNFKKKFPELYQEIINISFPTDLKWTQKLYHFFHDDLELKLGLCPTCGKRCKFVSFNFGYKHHCSIRCAHLDVDIKNKIKETCVKKYGVENYSQTDEYKERYKQTCLEKYGCENVFQNEEIKNKIKQTNIEKYGVESYSQTEEYRGKTKQTNIEKYGVEHYSKTREYIDRFKQTNLKKYGVEHYSKTDDCIEKMKQTCLERYGVEYYTQTVEYVEKSKQTCLKKYGVDNYSQTHESATKRKKRILYDNLMFDSSWEAIVYQYCKENNIHCVYQPNIQIKYVYDEKEHFYQPDFVIDGQLYEVKGEQFFDGDKMINPYDRNLDELFEAKHQCMIENDVIILRLCDIEKIKSMLKLPINNYINVD